MKKIIIKYTNSKNSPSPSYKTQAEKSLRLGFFVLLHRPTAKAEISSRQVGCRKEVINES